MVSGALGPGLPISRCVGAGGGSRATWRDARTAPLRKSAIQSNAESHRRETPRSPWLRPMLLSEGHRDLGITVTHAEQSVKPGGSKTRRAGDGFPVSATEWISTIVVFQRFAARFRGLPGPWVMGTERRPMVGFPRVQHCSVHHHHHPFIMTTQSRPTRNPLKRGQEQRNDLTQPPPPLYT